jgi:hypothetical protein
MLQPANGARAAYLGTIIESTPEAPIAECLQASDALTTASIQAVLPGAYICVLTNQGRLSLLRIDSVEGYGPNSLRVTFATWE